jgi:hypothetical protein
MASTREKAPRRRVGGPAGWTIEVREGCCIHKGRKSLGGEGFKHANPARLWCTRKGVVKKVNADKKRRNNFGFYALKGNFGLKRSGTKSLKIILFPFPTSCDALYIEVDLLSEMKFEERTYPISVQYFLKILFRFTYELTLPGNIISY